MFNLNEISPVVESYRIPEQGLFSCHVFVIANRAIKLAKMAALSACRPKSTYLAQGKSPKDALKSDYKIRLSLSRERKFVTINYVSKYNYNLTLLKLNNNLLSKSVSRRKNGKITEATSQVLEV